MTTQPKHTPAPWILDTGEDEFCISNGVTICRGDDTANAWAANARLIAAAPETAAERDKLKELNAELLAICQEIADSGCDLGDSERRIRLCAAINKADAYYLLEQKP